MNDFDRERAHRKSENLSHLKDEVDEKNAEHIERVRSGGGGNDPTDPEEDVVEQPQGSRAAASAPAPAQATTRS